jgi:hypothetical protein
MVPPMVVIYNSYAKGVEVHAQEASGRYSPNLRNWIKRHPRINQENCSTPTAMFITLETGRGRTDN